MKARRFALFVVGLWCGVGCTPTAPTLFPQGKKTPTTDKLTAESVFTVDGYRRPVEGFAAILDPYLEDATGSYTSVTVTATMDTTKPACRVEYRIYTEGSSEITRITQTCQPCSNTFGDYWDTDAVYTVSCQGPTPFFAVGDGQLFTQSGPHSLTLEILHPNSKSTTVMFTSPTWGGF